MLRKIIFVTLVVAMSVATSMFMGCHHQANDTAISTDIQSKVASDPATKDSHINVATTNGKVTLSGNVSSPEARQKVEEIAKEEPGTTGVDDQTTVAAAVASTAQDAVANAPVAPAPAPQPPPPPAPIVVPAGTPITVRTIDALGSKRSQQGQSFSASLAQPIVINGATVVTKGASVRGTVITAKEKGKIKGEGQLAIALTSIRVNGQTYRIRTSVFDSTIKGKGTRTAITTGGGAAGGALIGGIAGGGKGAGIGALAGAGAGLIGGAFTGNKQIEIPSETVLTFDLRSALTLPPAQQ